MDTRSSNSPAQRREALRREARRQATRHAVLEAAQRLFALDGYENTTVRAIADAAGVTERTFYRYFDGKEGLLAEEAAGWTVKLCDAIRARPPGEGPYIAARNAMIAVARELTGPSGDSSLARLIEVPRPVELIRRSSPRPLRRLEAAIADALHARRGAPPEGRGAPREDFDDQVVGRIAVAALRSAAIRHRALLATSGASPGLVQLLTEAFATISRVTSST
jgi:AcrR family transcriptional regulator